jgi:YVTN family beta-propeller protein
MGAQLLMGQLAADTLYVCNKKIGTISVVDTDSGDIQTSIISPDPLELLPSYIVTTPDATKAYVLYENSDRLSVIDIASNTIAKTITLKAVVSPSTAAIPLLAITPDGKTLYIVHDKACSVSVIDVATDTEVKVLSLATEGQEGEMANCVAIAPDGKMAYVTRSSSEAGALIAISTEVNEVSEMIPLSGYLSPGGIAILPDGSKAYVGDESDTLIIVDLKASTVVGSIQQECQPLAISFTPDGHKAYVTLDSDMMQIVNVANDSNGELIFVPSANQVVFSADGKTAFANNQLEDQISVIDVAKDTVKSLPGYSFPQGLAIIRTQASPIPDVVSSVVPSSPTICRGKLKKLSSKKGVLVFSWTQSTSPEVVRYDVYLDKRWIRSVDSASPLSFSVRVKSSQLGSKHRSKKYLRRIMKSYSIRAVTASGKVSQPVHPKSSH